MGNSQPLHPLKAQTPEELRRQRMHLVSRRSAGPLTPEQIDRIAARGEDEVHQDELGSVLLVIGWLLLTFDGLVMLFVPSDYRGGGTSVVTLGICLGAFAIVLIVAGLWKRMRVEQKTRSHEELSPAA